MHYFLLVSFGAMNNKSVKGEMALDIYSTAQIWTQNISETKKLISIATCLFPMKQWHTYPGQGEMA